MLPLTVWIAVFLISLLLLLKAAEHFTKSAEKIGLHFGLPKFIVGVTIVSVGTSLPELMSSVVSVSQGSSEIVLGNVMGSNITNIFLVLGVVAIIGKKMKINYEVIHVDLPLLVGSAFLLAASVWDRRFTLPEAIICIAGYVLYTLYTINVEKSHPHESLAGAADRGGLDGKTLIVLVASAMFIYVGAKYTVEAIINISDILNIGKEIIAASAVALGTSLPELVVSTRAVSEGKPELAIGNVLGSNIFNAFAVTGVSALFGSLIITVAITSLALPMMLAATLLYVFITQDKQITRWEGGLLLLFYVYYLGTLFNIM